MFNIFSEKMKAGLVTGFLISLQACVSAPQTKMLQQQVVNTSIPIAFSHEIVDVAFFPQEDFFCGPTTLSEILNFYGRDISPEQIAPDLFIPDRQGSLQIEMVSSIRQYGMLAYAGPSELLPLLSLVSDDIPVIVLQNLGLSWLPVWHYALVIGYDLSANEILLHTGKTQRRVAPMDLFENTWRKGGFWLLAAVPPKIQSKHFDPFVYVSAAQDLLTVNQQEAGISALETATTQWQEYWLSYFLLGNYYLPNEPEMAQAWFSKGLPGVVNNPSYLNNYAYSLLGSNCQREALDVIQQALLLDPHNSRLLSSLADISQAPSGSEACSSTGR
jgi:hypothetical protein